MTEDLEKKQKLYTNVQHDLGKL